MLFLDHTIYLSVHFICSAGYSPVDGVVSVVEEQPRVDFKLAHQSFYLIDRQGFNAGRSVRERLHENHDETEAAPSRDGEASKTARGGG